MERELCGHILTKGAYVGETCVLTLGHRSRTHRPEIYITQQRQYYKQKRSTDIKFRERERERERERCSTPEYKEKHRNQQREQYDPEKRKLRYNAGIRKPRVYSEVPEIRREQLREYNRKRRQDPEYNKQERERRRERMKDPKIRARYNSWQRDYSRIRWANDPEFRRKRTAVAREWRNSTLKGMTHNDRIGMSPEEQAVYLAEIEAAIGKSFLEIVYGDNND